MDIKFPRHLYKKGGEVRGYTLGKEVFYSTAYVTNEEEYEEALGDGFIDDFEKALFGEVEEVKVEKEPVKEDFDDDDF